MKKTLTLLLIICLTGVISAQDEPQSLLGDDIGLPYQALLDSNLSGITKIIITRAYNAATCEVVNPWTGACDVVGDGSLPSEKLKASNDAKKKAFVNFEDAIKRGKGKNILPRTLVEDAYNLKSDEGLSFYALRFKYILNNIEKD